MKTEDKWDQISEVLWWKRLIHAVIDYSFVLWIAEKLLRWYFTNFGETRDFFWIQVSLASVLVVFFGYFLFSEYFFGKTLGKLATKTKVVAVNGSDPTFGQLVQRTTLRLAFVEIFTYFKKHPVGWHDALSGTRVVSSQIKYPVLSVAEHSFFQMFLIRVIIGFYVFLVMVLVSTPFIIFSNWSTSQIVRTDEFVWSYISLEDDYNLKVPKDTRLRSRGPYLFATIPLRLLQPIEITELPQDTSPEEVLERQITLTKMHPLALVRLSDYQKSDSHLWYRYELKQAPVSAVGYFFRRNDIWYQVQFRGFKVDATEVLRAMYDYSIGQDTQL